MKSHIAIFASAFFFVVCVVAASWILQNRPAPRQIARKWNVHPNRIFGRSRNQLHSRQTTYVVFGNFICPPGRELYRAFADVVKEQRERGTVVFRFVPHSGLPQQSYELAALAESAKLYLSDREVINLFWAEPNGANDRAAYLQKQLKKKLPSLTEKQADVILKLREDQEDAKFLKIEYTPIIIKCAPGKEAVEISPEGFLAALRT
jgi:protein-disulfide isomerase